MSIAFSAHRAGLPAVGPIWFPAVMGTGLLATLLGREASVAPAGWGFVALVPAVVLLAVAGSLLLGLSCGFAGRCRRERGTAQRSWDDSASMPLWGAVAMGFMATGSAVLTVAPQLGRFAAWPVRVDAALWTVGTVLGLATAASFTVALLTRDLGRPVPAWGLALVPPMVSATTGAALIPHLGTARSRQALLLVTLVCFVVALGLGAAVFARYFHHHWTVAPLPAPLSVSAWIPLGVIGQSVAAAQLMAGQVGVPVAHRLADGFGVVMLALAVPVVMHAARLTAAGFRAGMTFTPGWWALTFPIGTLALGARLLGEGTGSTAISALGVAALISLLVTWTFCATVTVRALLSDPARV